LGKFAGQFMREMKKQTKNLKTLFLLALALLGISQTHAQETNETTLKNMLAAKTFVFKPQSAWPLQGTVIQLTPGFDMRLMGDSISTYLPYFGRAYQAGYTSNGNGISFNSSKFEYKLKEKSKGGWELVIKPSDTKDVTQLNYSISANGFATLQVLSNSRQAISFYGILEKSK